MPLLFGDCALDIDRRELRRGSDQISLGPQVFDLLVYLLRNRERVVSKDDMIEGVWGGRIVSESTLTSYINAARKAVGDSGDEQRLIRTVARKGFRFIGEVREEEPSKERPAIYSRLGRDRHATVRTDPTRQTLDRRFAVSEFEWRSRAGIFR